MIDRIKEHIAENFLLAVVLTVIFIAWIYNALVAPKFAIKDLDTVLYVVFGQHGINSVLNSPVPLMNQWRGGSVNATGKSGNHPDNG